VAGPRPIFTAFPFHPGRGTLDSNSWNSYELRVLGLESQALSARLSAHNSQLITPN